MLELKIGRYTYNITEKDLFLDNGSCVQLTTQSQEKSDWGHKPNPILSKRAIKHISKFTQVCVPYYSEYVPQAKLFYLEVPK